MGAGAGGLILGRAEWSPKCARAMSIHEHHIHLVSVFMTANNTETNVKFLLGGIPQSQVLLENTAGGDTITAVSMLMGFTPVGSYYSVSVQSGSASVNEWEILTFAS